MKLVPTHINPLSTKQTFQLSGLYEKTENRWKQGKHPSTLSSLWQDKSFKDDVDTALRAAILPHLVQFKELHCKDSVGLKLTHILTCDIIDIYIYEYWHILANLELRMCTICVNFFCWVGKSSCCQYVRPDGVGQSHLRYSSSMGEGCGLSPSPETARLSQWTFIGLKSVMFAFIWCFRLIIKWCDSHCEAGFWSGIGCSVVAHWCQQGSPLQVQHFPVTFRVLLDAFLNENQIECLAQWLRKELSASSYSAAAHTSIIPLVKKKVNPFTTNYLPQSFHILWYTTMELYDFIAVAFR